MFTFHTVIFITTGKISIDFSPRKAFAGSIFRGADCHTGVPGSKLVGRESLAADALANGIHTRDDLRGVEDLSYIGTELSPI